jgi:hypothetical protein
MEHFHGNENVSTFAHLYKEKNIMFWRKASTNKDFQKIILVFS